jgi:predicted Fe-Mo cluster-binding NifX family protein
MKIAVSAKGNTLESEVDPRFGRASYILIVDTKALNFEALDNHKNKEAFKGAGIQAAAMICDKEAEVLLTGYCGPNAFKTLDAAGIKVVNDQEGSVIEAIHNFNRGDVTYADSANTEGHW